jgi:hypothetical protein
MSQRRYMTMKRTTVYADEEDLAIIKEAAARKGISEAEIIRQAIHRAALAERVWDEPLFPDEDLVDLGISRTEDEVRATLSEPAERAARRLLPDDA